MSLPSRRPTFSLSSRSTPAIRYIDVIRAARSAGLRGADLDLAGSGLRRRFSGIHELANCDGIESLWVRPGDSDQSLAAAGLVSPLMVVDEGRGADPDPKPQIAAGRRFRLATEEGTRVALAVRPRNADGGRGHLARISHLRSIAEEWDMDLALDLTGAIDWLWEAEAAISRMMPRLRLIRLSYPLPALDGHVRARMTQRTVGACIELGYSGAIAVATQAPFWHWRNADVLQTSASAAVARLEVKFGVYGSVAYRDARQGTTFR